MYGGLGIQRMTSADKGCFNVQTYGLWASQVALVIKGPPAYTGDIRFDPWVGKIPWRKERQTIPVSCLENPMDRGAWWATIRRVTKSWMRLKQLSTQRACMHMGSGQMGGVLLLLLFKASTPSWEGLMGNRILTIISYKVLILDLKCQA